ncbi:MAG: DUF2207 domain-containing protein, partial [Patescibacteria group bacterium]
MKKLGLSLFFTAICFSLLSRTALADEELIQQFNSQAQINKDGTVDVLEIIKYNFPDERHGIFRQIPKVKVNEEKKRFLLSFSNISIKNEKGESYQYSDQSTKDELYLKIGDPNKTITGLHTYVISYKVAGALTYFEDHDELYWNATGNSWPVPIKEALVKVILPDNLVPDTYCYTGVVGVNTQNCTITNQGNSSLVKAQGLGVSEGLTFSTSFGKGVVGVLEPKEDVPSIFERIKTILIGAGITVGAFLWFIFLPLKIFLGWRRDKRFTKQNERIVAAWFDPPKNEDGSLYTAAETGSLIDKSIDFRDITASIIQLAQKGFLKIHVDEKKNFSFERLKDFTIDTNLQESEKDILSGIFPSSENLVEAKSLKTSTKFAKSITKFKESLSQELAKKKLFENDFTKVEMNNMGLGVAGLVTGNLILAIAAFVFGRKSAKRTLLGVEKYSESKSLENFLKSQDEQLDYQAKNQMFFEKLLPYATAFGVEDIWAKRFEDLKLTQPDWYDGNIDNTILISSLSRNIGRTIGSSVAYSNRSS